MDRWLRVFLVCLVVVLAGCAGLGGDTGVDDQPPGNETTPSEDEEPADDTADDETRSGEHVNESDREDTQDESLSNPPGVTDETVENPAALLEAHRTTLEGTNVTVSVGQRYAGESEDVRTWFTGKSVPGEDRAWIRVETQDGYGVFYTEDNVTYTKVVEDGTIRYFTQEGFPGEDEPRYGADDYVAFALTNATFERVGTATHDGVDAHWFRVTAIDAAEFEVENETIANEYDGELLVDEAGVIRSIALEETIETADGERHTFSIEVVHRDVGETAIERPGWYDDAGGE